MQSFSFSSYFSYSFQHDSRSLLRQHYSHTSTRGWWGPKIGGIYRVYEGEQWHRWLGEIYVQMRNWQQRSGFSRQQFCYKSWCQFCHWIECEKWATYLPIVWSIFLPLPQLSNLHFRPLFRKSRQIRSNLPIALFSGQPQPNRSSWQQGVIFRELKAIIPNLGRWYSADRITQWLSHSVRLVSWPASVSDLASLPTSHGEDNQACQPKSNDPIADELR